MNLPNKPGIWEWFTKTGQKKLVHVLDVGIAPTPWLRVYFAGGYYDVNLVQKTEGYDSDDFVPYYEWPERWGNYVGELNSISEDECFLGLTREQQEELFGMMK